MSLFGFIIPHLSITNKSQDIKISLYDHLNVKFSHTQLGKYKYQINKGKYQFVIDAEKKILYFCDDYQFNLNAKLINITLSTMDKDGIIFITTNNHPYLAEEPKYYQINLSTCSLRKNKKMDINKNNMDRHK